MKNEVRLHFLLVLVFSVIAVACNSTKVDDEFLTLIQVQNVIGINQELELRLDPYNSNELKNGAIIQLEILNKSNKVVRFPADRHIQIFFPRTDQEIGRRSKII